MPFMHENKHWDEKHSGAYQEEDENDEANDGVEGINVTPCIGARSSMLTSRRGSLRTGMEMFVVDESGQVFWISTTFVKRIIRYIHVFEGYYARKKASLKLSNNDSIRLNNIKIGIGSLYSLHLLLIGDVNVSNEHKKEYIRKAFQSVDLLDMYLSDRSRISCGLCRSQYSSGALERTANDVALLRCDFSFLSESEPSTSVPRAPAAAAQSGLGWRQILAEEQANRDRKKQQRMRESAAACSQQLAQAEDEAVRWRQAQAEEDEKKAAKKAEIDEQQEAKLSQRLALNEEQAAALRQLNEQYRRDEENRRLEQARRQAEAVLKEAQRAKRADDKADGVEETDEVDETEDAQSVYMPAPGRVNTPTDQSDEEEAGDDSERQDEGAHAPAGSPRDLLAGDDADNEAGPSGMIINQNVSFSEDRQRDVDESGSDSSGIVFNEHAEAPDVSPNGVLSERTSLSWQSDIVSSSDDEEAAMLASLIGCGASATATASSGLESRVSMHQAPLDTARTTSSSHLKEATEAAVWILRQRTNEDRDRPVTSEELASAGAGSANDHAEIERAREDIVSQANDILASERSAASLQNAYAHRILPRLSGRRDPTETFRELLAPPARGVIIGESHTDNSGPVILAEGMPSYAQMGVRHLYLEGIGRESQSALDAGFRQRRGLRMTDNQRLEPVVNAALREGIQVHGVDSLVAHAVNPRTGAALRVPLFNAQASTIINANATDGSQFLVLTGAAHVNMYSNVPGIAERTNATGVVIVDDAHSFLVGPGNQYDISDAVPPGQDPIVRPDYLFIAQPNGNRGMALIPALAERPDAPVPMPRSARPVRRQRTRRSNLPQTDPENKRGAKD